MLSDTFLVGHLRADISALGEGDAGGEESSIVWMEVLKAPHPRSGRLLLKAKWSPFFDISEKMSACSATQTCRWQLGLLESGYRGFLSALLLAVCLASLFLSCPHLRGTLSASTGAMICQKAAEPVLTGPFHLSQAGAVSCVLQAGVSSSPMNSLARTVPEDAMDWTDLYPIQNLSRHSSSVTQLKLGETWLTSGRTWVPSSGTTAPSYSLLWEVPKTPSKLTFDWLGALRTRSAPIIWRGLRKLQRSVARPVASVARTTAIA